MNIESFIFTSMEIFSILNVMEYNNDFSHDLELGNEGERLIGELFDAKTKIEVKTDLKAYLTGNLYIEYECRGKKSGIAKSKADYWAFVVSPDHRYFIKTETLKLICRKYLNTGRDVPGGDSNSSKGILLPMSELTNTDYMNFPPNVSLDHVRKEE